MQTKLTNTVRFPIGDWSDDGHGKCEWFTVKTNLKVEDIREIHFKGKKVLGFEIGEMCREYEEGEISEKVKKILKKKGIQFDRGDEEDYLQTRELLNVWLRCLKYIEPKFEYEVITEKQHPSINFYGLDSKKRHLDTPGYGLFQ